MADLNILVDYVFEKRVLGAPNQVFIPYIYINKILINKYTLNILHHNIQILNIFQRN